MRLLKDFGCFNEEMLQDVLDCGSKMCVYSANGVNKVDSFQLKKINKNLLQKLLHKDGTRR